MRDQVIAIGGDAIIGLDIDYVSFSADIMGVIASGTAVKLENLSSGTQDDTENKFVYTLINNICQTSDHLFCMQVQLHTEKVSYHWAYSI